MKFMIKKNTLTSDEKKVYDRIKDLLKKQRNGFKLFELKKCNGDTVWLSLGKKKCIGVLWVSSTENETFDIGEFIFQEPYIERKVLTCAILLFRNDMKGLHEFDDYQNWRID